MVLAAGVIGALALVPLVPPLGLSQVEQERRAVRDLARITQAVCACAVERGSLPRDLLAPGLSPGFLAPGADDQRRLDPFSPGAAELYGYRTADWSFRVESQGTAPGSSARLRDQADTVPLLAARTRRRLAIIHRVLERVLGTRTTLPEAERGWAPAVREAVGLGASFDHDAFRRPLVLEEVDGGYRVISVGADGRPGTADDLDTPRVVTTVEGSATEPEPKKAGARNVGRPGKGR